jgi:Zn-finger nucleic acid-binding protein
MVSKKPSEAEEEYIAREEAEKKRRLAIAQTKSLADADRERLKELHHMRCPRCGMALSKLALHGVEVARCFDCHGIFIGEADIKKLVGEEGYWSRVMQFFARKEYAKDTPS